PPCDARYTKDAFHRHIVNGESCINPDEFGTKAAVHFKCLVPARGSSVWLLRLTNEHMNAPLDDVESIVTTRHREADEFYEAIHPPRASDDEKLVQRQALAGLLWTKQIYLFDVNQWLEGDDPSTRGRAGGSTTSKKIAPAWRTRRSSKSASRSC